MRLAVAERTLLPRGAFTPRKITIAVLSVLALAFPVVTAGAAYAHGYVQSPPSRQYLCANGTVQNCGAIQWEPQSVEGPGNFPQGGPQDGSLCSGGVGRFAELDDPRGGNWPTTQVSSGSLTFNWTFTARHATDYYRYYITNSGWDPTQPPTRADLELIHTVEKNGEQPPSSVSHQVPLPSRSGQHLIYAVWEIDDTANAFYSCVDVTFN